MFSAVFRLLFAKIDENQFMVLFGQSWLLETNGFWPTLLESKIPIGCDCLVHFSDRQLPKQTNNLRTYFADLVSLSKSYLKRPSQFWSPFEWATTMLYIIWSNRFCIWKNPHSSKIIWKNPDSFKIVLKFGNHRRLHVLWLEQFQICPFYWNPMIYW